MWKERASQDRLAPDGHVLLDVIRSMEEDLDRDWFFLPCGSMSFETLFSVWLNLPFSKQTETPLWKRESWPRASVIYCTGTWLGRAGPGPEGICPPLHVPRGRGTETPGEGWQGPLFLDWSISFWRPQLQVGTVRTLVHSSCPGVCTLQV